MDIAGKTVLVTGAARRVGRAIALALAERGCDLLVHFNSAAVEASETVDLARAAGVRAESAQANLTDLKGIEDLFQVLDKSFDGLDLLVNSAAIMQPIELLQASEEDWDRTMNLNLRAPFFCIQLAAQRMHQRGVGAIVNISDVAGLRPWSRYPVHSISKAGLEMLTKVAARALAPQIRVNAIAPGPVLRSDWIDPPRWSQITEALPLRRGGSPNDVSSAVIFLLENDFITGETIVVDGGRNLI
jgi:NAD(P)-dependent dehydrogenase (short-subunit alcohol dehydrogenase family)